MASARGGVGRALPLFRPGAKKGIEEIGRKYHFAADFDLHRALTAVWYEWMRFATGVSRLSLKELRSLLHSVDKSATRLHSILTTMPEDGIASLFSHNSEFRRSNPDPNSFALDLQSLASHLSHLEHLRKASGLALAKLPKAGRPANLLRNELVRRLDRIYSLGTGGAPRRYTKLDADAIHGPLLEFIADALPLFGMRALTKRQILGAIESGKRRQAP